MDEYIKEAATNLIPMFLGAIGTGLMWVTKVIYRAKLDLDSAHDKIRNLQSQIGDLYVRDNRDCGEYSGSDVREYGSSAATRTSRP